MASIERMEWIAFILRLGAGAGIARWGWNNNSKLAMATGLVVIVLPWILAGVEKLRRGETDATE